MLEKVHYLNPKYWDRQAFAINVDPDQLASMAQFDARPTGDQEVAGGPPPGWQHSFMEI